MPEAATEKPLHELLSRSMVDIYVGPENTHWVLHEKLLCYHSPFFRKIFYSKDRPSKSFGLPDEEDDPFKTFVGWLYSSSLPVPREEADLGLLFDMYLMAEKFQIPNLVADVLQVVREWYKYSDTYPGLRRVQYIYANTEEGSPMRHMLVHSVARFMVLGKGLPQHWDKALRKNGQLAVDIIMAIQEWRLDEGSVPDARDDPEQGEELIDADAELAHATEAVDAEIEAEGHGEAENQDDANDEEDVVDDHEADDSEDTVVDSPVGVKQSEPAKGAKMKGDDLVGKKSDDFSKDTQKIAFQAIPNGLTNGDYGTLH